MVDERVSLGRATSSRLHERQYRVGDSCTSHYMRPSLGQSMFRGKRTEVVAQAVAQAHRACKRSLFGSLEAQQEVEAGDSQAEGLMVPWLARHEGT